MKCVKKSYCCNCGLYGHTYKQCNEPVTSYGIILYKHIGTEIKYLLVRRKDSLSYVEFIRGKYNINNLDYVEKLLNRMTSDEKNRLLNNTFEDLWNLLWIKVGAKQHKKEYNYSCEKFNELKTKKDNGLSNLELLINKTEDNWDTPEWGFPKGRRNLYEGDLNCAEREFNEESGLTKKDYIILKHINPVYEVFVGSNNVKYKHIYYVGLCLNDIEANINIKNKHQIAEIGDIGWYSYNECLKLIRPYNLEKKNSDKKN